MKSLTMSRNRLILLASVRRQNISDRKDLNLRDYLAHLVSFKPLCADGAAVGTRLSFAA